MRICVAQVKPIKGDIQKNIQSHKLFVDAAGNYQADIIIFPELSLTGYEPELAKSLAANKDDQQFDQLQTLSDAKAIAIAVGMPIKSKAGICIGIIIFQPNKPRLVYNKRYLHKNENEFFVAGEDVSSILDDHPEIGLAICYELSIPSHARRASQDGAQVYIASVVHDAESVSRCDKRLAEIANTHSMVVLSSNCIGRSGEFDCAGQSAVWNSKGQLLAQLADNTEGVLIYDTESKQVISKVLDIA